MAESNPTLARIMRRVVESPTGCWLWQGACYGNGYGVVSVSGRSRAVHRAVYELSVGPIPEGLQLDHLCRVRACCNPAHLEAVTQQENLRRGDINQYAQRDACSRGHLYADGSYSLRANGHRRCRECRKIAGS